MAALDAKTCEKQCNTVLTRYIYAAFKDTEAGWDGTPKNPLMFQSYDNLILKDDSPDKLTVKGRFTINTDVKQFVCFLFSKLIEENKNVDIVDTDSNETIAAKLDAANTDCYSSFMITLGENYKDMLGDTLKSAGDPSGWFRAQIEGLLPKYKTAPIVVAVIATQFDRFLKALAYGIACFIWYSEGSVNSVLFLGLMAHCGMSIVMRDEIESSLREKPPPKPKKKAGDTPATASAAAVAADGAAAPVDTSATPAGTVVAPTGTAPAAADSLKDVLANL